MLGRTVAPPPSANQQGFTDPRNVRHSCGFAYNGYKWGSCPSCTSDEKRQYALGCRLCGNGYYATERVDLCPDCGSGNTTVVSSPDKPRVR